MADPRTRQIAHLDHGKRVVDSVAGGGAPPLTTQAPGRHDFTNCGGEVTAEEVPLGDVADARTRHRVGRRFPEQRNDPRTGWEETQGDLDQRRLAGPVRSDERNKRAGSDRHVHVFKHELVSVGEGNVFEAENRFHNDEHTVSRRGPNRAARWGVNTVAQSQPTRPTPTRSRRKIDLVRTGVPRRDASTICPLPMYKPTWWIGEP